MIFNDILNENISRHVKYQQCDSFIYNKILSYVRTVVSSDMFVSDEL